MTEVQASSGVQHESPIELTNDQWSQKAMEILGQLWDDRSLADLEVHAQDGAVVQAHSCVLAAASSTLHSLISQMDLSNRAVSLPLTPGHLVESILKYIYSGKITCSGGDLESLVKMADYLCLPDLSRLLSDLVEKLPPKNGQSFITFLVCSSLYKFSSLISYSSRGRFIWRKDRNQGWRHLVLVRGFCQWVNLDWMM